MLLILYSMMVSGGCRFDLDSCVHVASASVSLALLGVAVVPLSIVDASCSAPASARSLTISSTLFACKRSTAVWIPLWIMFLGCLPESIMKGGSLGWSGCFCVVICVQTGSGACPREVKLL